MATKLRGEQLETGINPGNVVVLDGSSRLPAVDGSQLIGVAASANDRHVTADATAAALDAIYVTGDAITTPGQQIDNPNPGGVNTDDRFGWMVSLSDDGTRCAVSAPRDDTGHGTPSIVSQGAVRIYLKTGTTWAFESFLENPDPGPSSFDNFGISIMLSGDGTRCVVGAFGDDAGASNSGSVYVYNRVGTTWTLDTGGTIANPVILASAEFGSSVAINEDGDKIVIGAPNAAGTGAESQAGAAYIYSRSGEVWTIEQTVDNPAPAINDFFGSHVEMSNDGLRVQVSAPQDNLAETSSGTIYIYRRDSGGIVWSLEATIGNPDVGNDVDGRFGWSVRFDATADRMIVSNPLGNDEPQANSGVVYIYKRIGSEWILEQKIINPEPTGPANFGAHFGNRVEISGDGKRILVGVWLDDPGAVLNAGSAYLYGLKDGIWEIEQKLENPTGTPTTYDFYGGAVALDGDGTTISIGMWGGGGTGTYYAFDMPGSVFFYEAPIVAIDMPAGTAFDEVNLYNSMEGPIQITDAANKLNGSLGIYDVTRKTTIKLKYIDVTVGWLVIES